MIPTKVAIYARVSSQKQKDEETIDSQIDALRNYAKAENYILDEKLIFIDNGVSGNTLQRPALDELRDVVRFETIEMLLMYAPDRLSRNYTYQLILMEEFRKHGVKLYFLKNPPKTDSAEEKMFQHFQGIFAEYERALFLDRSRRGRIYKAKKGDPCIIPKVPYGYRKVKKDDHTVVEIVNDEAIIVKEIFRLYIHELTSYHAVARKITEKGVKTPSGKIKWDQSTIRDILKNHAYIGTSYFGKTEQIEKKTDQIRRCRLKTYTHTKYSKRLRPENEWIPISVPAIISENDFELAQEKMGKNKQLSPRNTKRLGLLQGLVICGVCGKPYYRRTVRGKGHYYCSGNSNGKIRGTKCSNKYISENQLDENVFSEIISLLQTPELIENELARRVKESSNTEELRQREILTSKELTKLERECNRLLDAYQAGVMELNELKQRNHDLGIRRKNLQKDLQNIQAAKIHRESGFNFRDFFDNALKKMKMKVEGLSFDEKRKLIRLLVEEIVIEKETITIVHCISPKAMEDEKCQLKADGALKPIATIGSYG